MSSNIAMGAHRKTYVAWVNMHQRCYNTARPDYSNYGGRGITVCKEWFSYDRFLADMGKAPQYKTLDRNDNDKGYCKTNCSWESHSTQMLNRRERRQETKLRPTNSSGIAGVYWTGAKQTWQVKAKDKATKTFSDLLDACCYRLSKNTA